MRSLLLLLILTASFGGYSQFDNSYEINFEDTTQFFRINIDTISNPNNNWQIGSPHKTRFTSALSPPNVIVTDTKNPYPEHDTSRFIITHIAGGGFQYDYVVLFRGKYRVDSDSNDFGMIEFSPDNGKTWVDLINDTFYYNRACYEWYGMGRPVLSGYVDHWQSFELCPLGFKKMFNIEFGDTLLYRFSFISDSIPSNRDGLMFDDFYFDDWYESIEKIQNDFESKVFPNPSNGEIKISFENEQQDRHKIGIHNATGEFIFEERDLMSDQVVVNLSKEPSGVYFYILKNQRSGETSAGKIIKR